ncbi:condensation domain-containing protein [Actinomadura gamaensis]|uniref:Condensation domain-containing protein n=1 Tax=Actinomadura gamaensis TaxID=1763541 RepID=A0ABV9TXQ5_9ACTN
MRSAAPKTITRTYLNRFGDVRAQHAGPDADLLPVTGAQRRFLHTASLDPLERRAVVPLFLEYPAGTVSVPRLAQAARAVVGLNPALRSTVEIVGGIPVQRVRREGDVTVEEVPDVRTALDDWPEQRGPFRLLLARESTRDLLALAFDHVACDEFSIGLIIEQLADAYAKDQDAPVAGTDPYGHAVARQLEREDAASGPEAVAHWERRLAQAAPGHWGRGVPLNQGGPSRSVSRRVAPADLSGQARSKLFPTLLAACRLATADYRDVAPVSYAWGGRAADDDEPVVGCFINTVVACPAGESDDPYEDALFGWWEDLEWADTPFDEVLRAARRARLPWAGHLDVLLTLDDRSRRPSLVLDGVRGEECHMAGMRVQAPIVVSASYDVRELRLRVDRDPALVPDETAGHVADTLAARLGATAR